MRAVIAVTLVLSSIAVSATAVAVAAPAVGVATSPGRVLLTTDGGRVDNSVDAGGGGRPFALSDGGVLLVGVPGPPASNGLIVKLDRSGRPDLSFGSGGATALPISLNVVQVIREADGRLLLIGTAGAAGGVQPEPLQVARLLANGALDPSFGSGGLVDTGIGIGCGSCTSAAVGPDGSIVITGANGTYPTNPTPTTVPDIHWVVTRLRPDGSVDQPFGDHGVATIGGASASGFNVAVLPGGQVLTEGQTARLGQATILLARLTAKGEMDPAFGGGAPVTTPLAYGFPMLVRSDGSIVISGGQQGAVTPPFSAGTRYVVAYTPGGALDTTFSEDGLAETGAVDVQQLLASSGRGLTVIGIPAQTLTPGSVTVPGTFMVGRWPAAGPPADAWQSTVVRFGGGGSSFLISVRPRPLPSLAQNSFTGRELTMRPDGSFLAVGGVRVTQPTGEGTGYSIGRSAIAALTAALLPDGSFGGAATRPKATVSVPLQRARTAWTRHGVRVRTRASSPGLWRVKIRTPGGRVLAQSVLPIFRAATKTLPVELTRTGNLWLRRHRHVKVAVSVTARDLFGAQTTTRANGTLH